jgi:hypothetical protein
MASATEIAAASVAKEAAATAPVGLDAATCRACGGRDLEVDAVQEGDSLSLSLCECRRCRHRWTAPLLAPSAPPCRAASVRPARRRQGVPAAA